MKCVNCGKENAVTFFTELIPCSHCNKDNSITYNVCQDCNSVWKAIDGKPLTEMLFSEAELSDLLGDTFGSIVGFIEFEEGIEGTMNEVVHRCIRCDTQAYEVKPGLYHCPDCSFEWEIL
jgi:DNA-directed RNA polymerase subunit RPC12/RpoP